MITHEQFAELIKPQPKKVTTIKQFIDPDRAKFLQENASKIKLKLDKTRISKIDALPSQIKNFSLRRNPSRDVKLEAYTDDDRHGYGRVKPVSEKDISLVEVTRPVRQFLIREFCTDIDMKDAHPVIMNQLFQLFFQRSIVELNEWNANREEFFKVIVDRANKADPNVKFTRDDAKKLAFIWLYEGDVNKFFIDNGLDVHDPEVGRIYLTAFNLKKHSIDLAEYIARNYKSMWDKLPSNASKHRLRCSKLSWLLQHIERRIIVDTLVPIALEQGLIVRDICHDGFLLSTPDNQPLSDDQVESLLPQLNAAAMDKFGLAINMVKKEMIGSRSSEEMSADILDRWYTSASDNSKEVGDDKEAAEKFIALYDGRLKYCSNDWFIRPLGDYFWCKGESSVKGCIMHCEFYKLSPSKKRCPYSANTTGCNNIFAALKAMVRLFTDDDFVVNTNNRFIGTVHWIDKHMTFPSGLVDNDPASDYAPLVFINRKAPIMKVSEEAMEKLNKLLQGLDEIQRKQYYHIVGRMAYGHISDKKWTVLDGLRHTSKSSVTGIIYKAFDGICCSVETPLVSSIKGDPALALKWVLSSQCHLKRIAIFAEKTTNTDMNGRSITPIFDGNIIKKVLANGGNDKIDVRGLHRDQVSVVISAGFIGSLNGLPKSDPSDAMDTVIPITMKKQFTDNEKDARDYPHLFILKDQAVANYVNDPDVIDCFTVCCLKAHYKDEPFVPASGTDMAEDTAETRRVVITPLMVYQDFYVEAAKPDSVAWADDVLLLFQRELGNPSYTSNSLTYFLKGFGHTKAKQHDRLTDRVRPYWTRLQLRNNDESKPLEATEVCVV